MATEVLTANDKVSNAVLVKAGAGVFVTVVAPVLVAVGMRMVDKVTPPAPAAEQMPAAVALPAATAIASTQGPAAAGVAAAPAKAPSASAPETHSRPAADDLFQHPRVGPIVRLFNGRDRSGFYSYLGPPEEGAKPIGRGPDRDRVFSARGGALHVSGKTPGALITDQEYANYWLKLRYRWGDRTWAPRADRARSSGVLLHCRSPEGAVKQSYPLSIRCDLIEGSSGDMVPYGGPNKLVSINVEARLEEFANAEKYKQLFCYEPGHPLTTVTAGFIKRRPVNLLWKDATDYRGPGDIERAHGEWNDLECICLGNRIVVRLNGTTVNDITSNLTSGKIALQSTYAEIHFRDVELQRLAAP